MCFVDPRPPLLPEAKPKATTAVEGPQNTLLSRGLSKYISVLLYSTVYKCQSMNNSSVIEVNLILNQNWINGTP